MYSNGRMRYTYHQRQDRREHQGDVSGEHAGGREPECFFQYTDRQRAGGAALCNSPARCHLPVQKAGVVGSKLPAEFSLCNLLLVALPGLSELSSSGENTGVFLNLCHLEMR